MSSSASWHSISQVSSPSPSEESTRKTEGGLDSEQTNSNIPLKSIEHEGESSSDSDSDSDSDSHDINDRGDARDDSDYVKSESESDVEIHRFNRKRSLESAFSQASASRDHRAPRKHIRRALNPRYVDLLNDDIEDIRRRYVPDDWPQLRTTQIGLTVWDEEEKEVLYEAIGRLGRDDVPGIAQRLSTKSEIEVRHYLYSIREGMDERRARLRDPLLPPPLSEFPAAVEIGSKCCAALGVEAGLVVQREARDEAKNEESAWGRHWLVNGANCGHLSKAALASAGVAADDDDASNRSMSPMPGTEAVSAESTIAQMQTEMRPEAVAALALLNTPNMLLLSERVFMNGVAKEDNYLGLGSELPAVQTSALRDMYGIVFSLTQRLVATAIHMSQSRDRAQQAEAFKRLNKNVVHVSDVHAAISTLGLKRDMQEFWARCPRRLGLRVSRRAGAFGNMHTMPAKHRGADGADGIYAEDDDAMTYSEAEHELEPEPTAALQTEALKDVQEDGDDSNSVNDDDDDDDVSDSDSDDTEARISLEADEILNHSATGFPNVNWARQILRKRIGDELKEEAQANAVDKHRSNADELYLWKVLGKTPPPSAGPANFDESRPHVTEGAAATAKRLPVDQIIDTGRNWRAKLQYEAEWEDAAGEVQRLVDEAQDHDMAV